MKTLKYAFAAPQAAPTALITAVLAQMRGPVPASAIHAALERELETRVAIGALYVALDWLVERGDVFVNENPTTPNRHLFQLTEIGRGRLSEAESRDTGGLDCWPAPA